MPREPEVRISPFALPSDTELRFGLLVWAVLATALLLDHVAYSALHGPAYARAVAAAIAAYCDRLHIGQCPRLFVRNSRIPSAVAFCYGRRAALILNLGLLLQFRMNPVSFRAVVLHELAHVRNGDIGRTFVSLAAVIALFVASVVPYLVSIALISFGPGTADRDAFYIFGVIWRAAVLILVVLLALAGVLRDRW